MSVPAHVALVGGWTTLVGWALVARRPRPTRALAPASPLATSALDRVGRRLRQLVGRPADTDLDRLVGLSTLLTVLALAVAPPVAPLIVVGALGWRQTQRRRGQAASSRAGADALPETVELFSIALGGGLSVPAALGLVGPRAPDPLGPALTGAHVRFRHGEPLAESLARVIDETTSARPLVAILVAAHSDGAPSAEPLARLAADLRVARQRDAETRARKVPVRLLFPLVLCTLPAFILITVVPAVLSALSSLRL